jgi:uncharacterized membrane protein
VISPSTPVSATITEVLLKVALNTINHHNQKIILAMVLILGFSRIFDNSHKNKTNNIILEIILISLSRISKF